jgi:hypothetical protein
VNTSNPDYVTFTLAAGGTINLPWYKEIDITVTQSARIGWNKTGTATFKTTGDVTSVKVLNVPDGWKIDIAFPTGSGTGSFTITAPECDSPDLEALILASNAAGSVAMSTLELKPLINTPPDAARTYPYTQVSGGQVWSYAIQCPDCDKEAFVVGAAADCRSVHTGTAVYYYYNWAYVNANKDKMCPSPWRVPTVTDFVVTATTPNYATLNSLGVHGGYYDGSVKNVNTGAYIWSSTEDTGIGIRAGCMSFAYNSMSAGTIAQSSGMQVRCVRAK